MQTLTYGFKKPQTGDAGSVFFPAMSDNAQLVNDHSHNGTNSALLSPTAITALSQTYLAATWASISGGYRTLVTMPSGTTYTGTTWTVFNNTTKELLSLDAQYVSTNSFYLLSNDNTIDLLVVYR